MKEFISKVKPDTTDYDTFRERVIKECNISRVTYYKWENGSTVSEKYKPIINQIAEEIYGKPAFEEEGGEK